jgi:hypothetical protein
VSGLSDTGPTVVRCPGCGGRTACAAGHARVVRCGWCLTPLMLSFRRLDVECTVRERLYGAPPRGISRAVPGH